MKIYLNRKPVKGPWGGGNKIVATLANHLQLNGHEVVYNLNVPNIDVLFCFVAWLLCWLVVGVLVGWLVG